MPFAKTANRRNDEAPSTNKTHFIPNLAAGHRGPNFRRGQRERRERSGVSGFLDDLSRRGDRDCDSDDSGPKRGAEFRSRHFVFAQTLG